MAPVTCVGGPLDGAQFERAGFPHLQHGQFVSFPEYPPVPNVVPSHDEAMKVTSFSVHRYRLYKVMFRKPGWDETEVWLAIWPENYGFDGDGALTDVLRHYADTKREKEP